MSRCGGTADDGPVGSALEFLGPEHVLQQSDTQRSDSGPGAGQARPSSEPDDDIPPPEAPDYPDDPGPIDYEASVTTPPVSTPEDEEEMFAEAAEPADPTTRRDPEDVAFELLKDMLGAKKLEG